MAVIDEQRRIVWTSEGIRSIPGMQQLAPGIDARDFLAKLPRPEQVFPLRSSLRGRSHLEGAPLEICVENGRAIPVDLDLARIPSDEGDLLVVIAAERLTPSGDGLDAALLDALRDAVLAIDESGFVRRANPAALELLECSADQILARSVTSVLASRTRQLEQFAEALRGPQRIARCELSLVRRSAGERTVEISVTPLGVGGRAIVLRDVTAQRDERQRLVKANEELDHCIGALAHDLRSPLVSLIGFSRLLRHDYEELLDATGRHFVDRIEQAARTMESLISDLLELARIGEPGERAALVDPREVLLQLAAEFKPRLEAAGIELTMPGVLASRVYCDRSRLYQLFSNLIGNAIDHMGPRPNARIEVRIEEDDEAHEITVADNGRGIDRAHRERIFEIFQSIGTRSDGKRGTGMGLAIVKKIAERRGGRVWVESEPGQGAQFHVRLPRC
jgi:PAS domain S-box-containing protein